MVSSSYLFFLFLDSLARLLEHGITFNSFNLCVDRREPLFQIKFRLRCQYVLSRLICYLKNEGVLFVQIWWQFWHRHFLDQVFIDLHSYFWLAQYNQVEVLILYKRWKHKEPTFFELIVAQVVSLENEVSLLKLIWVHTLLHQSPLPFILIYTFVTGPTYQCS